MSPSSGTDEQARHESWMRLALEQAQLAAAADEVPVGAVLVRDGVLVAAGYNQPIRACDPTAHAEIVTLRNAARAVGNYRLPGSVLYVTIEPCTMCLGAVIHARVGTVVFAAREPRAGAVVSRQRLDEQQFYNHQPAVIEGVLATDCAALMQAFFAGRRTSQ
ncbi:MAG: tRNA adenosine(34) deaminase TadA [Pseudohongiellaceae bacterium]